MSKSTRTTVTFLAVVLAAGCQSQRTFSSPEEAVMALTGVARTEDRGEIRRLFGPHTEKLKSGDPEQDHEDLMAFRRRIEAAHKVQADGSDRATLLIGAEEWPFAVPLVRQGQSWRFDTEAGVEELTNRRIGHNELRTLAACRTLIDAQRIYASVDRDGDGAKQYAQRLMSSPGKRDGLYWLSEGGVDPSPIGPVLAAAASRTDERGQRLPYYGYRYKLLLRQGASAPGGAMDYRVDGKLARGWAVLAYPAEYGKTGVMSFTTSHAGAVYEQDLGESTETVVNQTESFDPGAGWQPVKP